MADDTTPKMVTVVPLYDMVGYHDADGATRYFDRDEEAAKGVTEFEITQDEFKRLSNSDDHPPNGAVAKSGTKAAREAADESGSEPTP